MNLFPEANTWLRPILVDEVEFDFRKFFAADREENIGKVLARLSPMDFLGKDYEGIFLPGVPCLDILSTGEIRVVEGFIKARCGISAMSSGKRSCIMGGENGFIRLKGCGNLDLEFNVENMEYPVGGKEIRGCCFEYTVIREQFMTFYINEKLKEFGLFTGNFPLKYWKYHYACLPAIDKYCGVFATFGEKRLGSHLISGITQLLLQIEPHLNLSLLQSLFPESRLTNSQITPTIKLLKQQGPLNTSLSFWTSQDIYLDNSLFLNILENSNYDWIPPIIYEDSFTSPMPLKDFILQLLNLTWRIGWEVGVTKRILQDSEISWGYFIDHNPFEPHCNSHCNNFVILGEEHENLLAPVDFDMAFRAEEFVSTVQGENFGKKDLELFENWVNCERMSLEYTLAGQENMANFTYGTGSSESLLLTVVRDLMVLAFREAFEKKINRFKTPRKEFETALKACMNLTRQVIDY